MTLNKKLIELEDEKAISLHVPGHHNNTIGSLNQLNLAMDKTEITGLDDLHQPEGCIKESMDLLNRFPQYTGQYLVNGTTVGILSAIYAVQHLKGEILIPRNAHKSIYNALNLTRQDARWMPMTVSEITGQYNGVGNLSGIDLSNVKLAIFTYPNYYGETFNIDESIKLLQKHHIPVLVDEAHGAHFGISSYFPESTLTHDADIVVQSYHKTLPALTMGSVMYINDNLNLKSKIQDYLTMLQSSSPSYLIMSSLEHAEDFYKRFDDEVFKNKRTQLIASIKRTGFYVGCLEDPLKLIVSHDHLTGFEVQRVFEDSHIYVELCNENYVLIVLPLWHDNDRFPFEILLERISHINIEGNNQKIEKTQMKLPVHSANKKYNDIEKIHEIELNKSVNRISAVDVIPYPPGIPVILKGEQITKEVVDSLLQWIDNGGRVEGIINKYIKVKDEQ
ncbi:aminotransferase class I/II-fold pyridoxal phosphate-dependent enzyme [Mammaliicoccus sp. Dog046]|uniref:aminotransferase class I/II-fold pyridoxal phosphate-dependent enzyme n=1 Tax=Mammaliicoccus sp. Dog046 TaxID=3034233 RepID=UPI002B2646A2|nr:aminotransferase class I/II-fold pyridoxal phosphate-dependent enzyme [Mammaliicoccus sp. Dog046]WQK85358.1 aminotransferase class I/II-fold pyridoxal phosphate-dependent enzyme [Mammaliicoccus sp. Dog046]